MRRRAARAALFLISLFATVTPAGAQVTTGMRLTNLAANAAIGGLVAGARSMLRRRPGATPVLLGAAGGALQSVGRQMAATGVDGAGFLGREISAAGISLTYSAGVDSLVGLFPLGPVLLELRPRDSTRVRFRVNAVDVGTIAVALVDGRSDFQLGASLSIGAPVFQKSLSAIGPDLIREGYTQVGVVFVSPVAHGGAPRPEVLRHEAVHVLQWDAIHLLAGAPVERAALSRVRGLGRFTSHVDVGLVAPAVAFAVASSLEYDRHPWEREAYTLTTGQPTFRQPAKP